MSLRPATEIRVLGPLEVVGAEGVVALTASKERLLLAALLIDPGKVRSPDSLIEALWGASPPRSAPKLLQVYVSKLRKSLPAPVEIRTRDAGYLLEISGGLIDSVRFERLLAEGREAGRAGNHALAGSLLRRGLALWRGPAFGDLAYEEVAHAEAERLEELRLAASEERIAAELALGLHVELLPELQVLARAHPLRERLQAQAMLALYRAGHQADALEVYRSTRAMLANDLGLEPEAELRDLHQRILHHDPSLAVLDAAEQAPVSLPVPPNPLRGRERELRDLHELLSNDDVRLLVLTGAGGSGKTRLAIAAARESAASFSNGVVLVELAPLREPDHLLGAISNALGIPSVRGAPIEALSEALGSREELLVLDNIEHLRPAVGGLVELLGRAPRLKLLVTSRVVLHLSGEHVYPVDPLPVDAAVALFLERARGADARFDPDTAEVRTIEHICDRLDRLPLAIELAASRVRSFTPSEIAGRLEARLTLLAGGPRDLPARQQTLRATLEWSFELLGADERDDLVRLSVFAGGCDLAAAEAVAGTTFERVSTLVDHNLLVRTVGEFGSRYSMLETIREFAAERLEASGEAERLRRRHAEYALVVAESLGLSVDESSRWVEERHGSAAVEQDNMRAALDWALEADPELGLELAVALEQFWITTNPAEGADRIGELLQRSDDCSPSLRARALRDLGGCIQISGGGVEAQTHYEASLEIYERLEDEIGILKLRHRLATMALMRGDLPAARGLAEEWIGHARAAGSRFQESEFLDTLSHVDFYEGNVESAYDLQLQSLEIVHELGIWRWGESIKQITLADLASRLGRQDDAETHGLAALSLSRETGDRNTTAFSLASLAVVARARGAAERAGTLWGSIEAEEERMLLGRWAAYGHEYADRVLDPDDPEFELGRRRGRELTLGQAVAFAHETGRQQ